VDFVSRDLLCHREGRGSEVEMSMALKEMSRKAFDRGVRELEQLE
jgi:hypothetical protein